MPSRVDELLPQLQQEFDPEARQGMIDAVRAILKYDVADIPQHIQPLVWAMRQGVEVRRRQANLFFLCWVRLDG